MRIGGCLLIVAATGAEEVEWQHTLGFLPAGHDILTSEMSIGTAKDWCAAKSDCAGFTFDDTKQLDKSMIFFKGKGVSLSTGGQGSGWRSFIKGEAGAPEIGWPAKHKRSKHTATGCPDQWEDLSETDRQMIFTKLHQSWPPQYQYPGEKNGVGMPMKATEAWNEYMRHKERRLMAIGEHKWRWERWLEQVQIRNLRNWTASGWALDEMPQPTHDKVLKHFQDNHDKAYDEGMVAGYIEGKRSMLALPRNLNAEVTTETQKLVAKWAGYKFDEIEPTSTYGIRTYYDGSILETHVDRVETHILSAVYCVDRKHNKPWLMETDPDLLGAHAKVDIPPGALFFYESAKLSHGRPTKLDGDYYAHIFM